MCAEPSACDLSQTATRSASDFAVVCSVGGRSASAPKISDLAGGMGLIALKGACRGELLTEQHHVFMGHRHGRWRGRRQLSGEGVRL